MDNIYQIRKRVATLQEYSDLCTQVGWKDYMNLAVAEASLKQSLFGVVIEYQNETVGMGRIIGDGSIYFYIQDIAVSPNHQKKGLGDMIMKTLMEYLKSHAPDKAFVGLFANQGTQKFYNKYGIQAYQGMEGMFTVINKSVK